MEAEEARQRLKEQSIFVSAAVGTGPASELQLHLESHPGKDFSQPGSWEGPEALG